MTVTILKNTRQLNELNKGVKKQKTIFKEGGAVIVDLPNRRAYGKIFAVKKGYKQLTGETCYEVHGKEFMTITSARKLSTV
jgi:hypothetical protein